MVAFAKVEKRAHASWLTILWKSIGPLSYDIAMKSSRTALLIRCDQDDLVAIRTQADTERRSMSGCVLRILDRSLQIEKQFSSGLTESFLASRANSLRLTRWKSKHVSMLLRCSQDEAAHIRAAAKKTGMSISEFVVFSLRRHWKAVERLTAGDTLQ